MHPNLTYRMKNNRIGCLNRDKNNCLNMLEIVETWKKRISNIFKKSVKRCQMNIKSLKTRFLYLVQFLFVLGIITNNYYNNK